MPAALILFGITTSAGVVAMAALSKLASRWRLMYAALAIFLLQLAINIRNLHRARSLQLRNSHRITGPIIELYRHLSRRTQSDPLPKQKLQSITFSGSGFRTMSYIWQLAYLLSKGRLRRPTSAVRTIVGFECAVHRNESRRS